MLSDVQPDPQRVREALLAVLESKQFSGAERRKQLLGYLVEETLAGRGPDLKEYRIGVDVYGRSASDYDPRIDPVVRVDIGRLRAKLSEYYAGEGCHAPLRLELPKGTYSVLIHSNGVAHIDPAQDTVIPVVTNGNGTVAAHKTESPVPAKKPRWRPIAAVATALLICALAGYAIFRHIHASPHAPHSIALIPFANLSEDHADDYFTDGLADEVTVMLGRIQGLRVIARPSTVRFRNSKQTPSEIGHQLGVETVLSGSVQKSGNRVRVIAQLTSAADGSQIWSDSFDAYGLDALGLEDRIAGAVASKLGGSVQRTYVSKDPAVHDLYLRGHFLVTQQTPASVLQAIDLFHQALVRDPNDPESLRELAGSEVYLASAGQMQAAEANRIARPLIEKAVAADPADGMSHLMLGYMLWLTDRNWPAAEAQFKQAVKLSPNSPDVRNNYGYMLMYRGRLDEAQVQFIRGREIDPLSLMPHFNMCGLYYYMKDYPHAEAECRAVLRINPKHFISRLALANILSLEGQPASAFQELDAARGLTVSPELLLAYRTMFLSREGKRKEAGDALHQLETGPGPMALMARAEAWLAYGDLDKAFEYLDRAYKDHDGVVYTAPFDPAWASARWDPRFRDLFARILQ